MPRTKGCSCCASQISAAASRSSSLKRIGERVPEEQLVGLQKARRPPGPLRRLAGCKALVGDGERPLLEAGGGLGEEVEEARVMAATQRLRHARTVITPGSEVGQEGERDVGPRPVQREPGDVGGVGLSGGQGSYARRRSWSSPSSSVSRSSRASACPSPSASARKSSPAAPAGKRAASCAKLRRSLARIEYCSLVNSSSDRGRAAANESR